MADAGLAQDVEPERRLAVPAMLAEPALGGRQRLDAELAGDRLARGQSGGLAALEIARGERPVGIVVDVAGDRLRQADQRRGQAPVDPFRPLRRGAPGDVEEQRPVDRHLGPHRRKPDQVREQRQVGLAIVDPVAVADLRVAVAVRGVGELERDERLAVDPVALAAAIEQPCGELGSDQGREEVVQDHPLVVPGEREPRLVEHRRLGLAVRAQPIDEQVVGAQEGDLQLVHEQVAVVARVADQRHALGVAGDVDAALAEQQPGGVVALVEIGRPDRPTAVDGLEVRPRRAVVAQRIGIGPVDERGAIGGDVMGDELAEERPSGLDRGVVAAVGLERAAVAGPADNPEPVQAGLLGLERRQGLEQAAIAAAGGRAAGGATGRQAVVANRRVAGGATHERGRG